MRDLQQRYTWPATCPDVPDDMQGWFHGQVSNRLAELLSPETRVVVELGSWKGMSADFIVRHAPNATVICIDHWEGSREHHNGGDLEADLPTLHATFLRNLWPHRGRVIPMRTTTLDGMGEVALLEIRVDVLYIDASHEEPDVFADLMTAMRLFPGSRIVGDDWTWPGVRAGVQRAMATSKRIWRAREVCWEVQPE